MNYQVKQSLWWFSLRHGYCEASRNATDFEAAVQLISLTANVTRVSSKIIVYLLFDNSKDFDYLAYKGHTAEALEHQALTHSCKTVTVFMDDTQLTLK